MSYCTNCGNEISFEKAYCPHCGEKVRPDIDAISHGRATHASLGQRAGAIIVDTFIMLFVWGLLFYLIGVSILAGGNPSMGSFYGAVLTELIFVAAYTISLEGYWNGQTVGKKVFEIQVVDAETGVPITVNEAVIRNVIRVIDFLPVFYLVAIGAIYATGNNQRLGDLAANTLVVKL